MPDREPFTPPDVPQPDFAGEAQSDGAELANQILEGEGPETREEQPQGEQPQP
ncbi:hypothetical protein SAMN05444161_6875 [Rhizobiales bacterium GAS191]|nr:hypothetical protein SAMN05444161_6875 [Rhizobiales bacterium GAS191]